MVGTTYSLINSLLIQTHRIITILYQFDMKIKSISKKIGAKRYLHSRSINTIIFCSCERDEDYFYRTHYDYLTPSSINLMSAIIGCKSG